MRREWLWKESAVEGAHERIVPRERESGIAKRNCLRGSGVGDLPGKALRMIEREIAILFVKTCEDINVKNCPSSISRP